MRVRSLSHVRRQFEHGSTWVRLPQWYRSVYLTTKACEILQVSWQERTQGCKGRIEYSYKIDSHSRVQTEWNPQEGRTGDSEQGYVSPCLAILLSSTSPRRTGTPTTAFATTSLLRACRWGSYKCKVALQGLLQ